ncbi:MAG TPA: hypothetical protein VMV72_17825 [Verrucomicrobiae bacterium]|nr:hypothetical protein [Verrucomicrobiae bacterium]
MNEIIETPKETSLKRLEANRRNCQKSTGPKTKRGKATSRMNAVKHGMLSSQVVVHGLQVRERSEDFQELREELWKELAPVGTVEEMLVDRVVTAHWRIRRALTAEAGEIVLSVDGGHRERAERNPVGIGVFLDETRDPVLELEKTTAGLAYLTHVLGGIRERVLRAGGLTEEVLGHIRSRFGGRVTSLERDLVGLRDRLAAGASGLSAEELKEEERRILLHRIDGKLSLYQEMSGACEEREQSEESARQAAEVLPSPAVLDKILRYEATVERQLYRALNQLERLQRRRNGEEVPPPLTMDVSRKL